MRDRAQGDIIATTMGWLNDVEAGGGTGFMVPGYEMLFEPRRGSLAFWYGLYANSEMLAPSSHGGCPVLMGQKWILNKWLYSFEQWDKFPCQMSPYKRVSTPFQYY